MLSQIIWDVSPVIFTLGPLSVRWYGLAFAVGFIVGYNIVAKMFKHEDYYSQHPGDILKIWEGGLASHGGTIANIIALFLFSWLVSKKPASWTFDKIVVPTAFVAALIRLGNLMNSEIYGGFTELPWGFIFVRDGQTLPAHPTQLYEAMCYLALFGLLMWMYWKKNAEERPWLMTGIFFIGIFLPRFLIIASSPALGFSQSVRSGNRQREFGQKEMTTTLQKKPEVMIFRTSPPVFYCSVSVLGNQVFLRPFIFTRIVSKPLP